MVVEVLEVLVVVRVWCWWLFRVWWWLFRCLGYVVVVYGAVIVG